MIPLQLPSNLVTDLQGVQLIDISKLLPVNPNYTWAELAGVRKDEDLTTIVCHHDAWPKKNSARYTDIQLAQKIAQDHINSKINHPKGDPGFPYDLWIRSGIIYICNDIPTREYGVASNNGYTVNVCVSGDYANFDVLTDADRKALYAAYFLLVPVLPSFKHLKGHGEINPTSCPGYNMNQVRNDIDNLKDKMDEQNSWNSKIEMINKIPNQINYMNNLIMAGPSDGKAQWALNQQIILYDTMKRQGLL